jgi:hypothetical protein
MKKTSLLRAAGALSATSAFVALLAGAGCASGRSSVTRPVVAEAKDLPDHFMVVASGIAQRSEPKPGEGCRNPMVDARDGTTLNLIRSKDGAGDYQVMNREYELKSQYGVDSQHLLRVDCATGKALGIVDQ